MPPIASIYYIDGLVQERRNSIGLFTKGVNLRLAKTPIDFQWAFS